MLFRRVVCVSLCYILSLSSMHSSLELHTVTPFNLFIMSFEISFAHLKSSGHDGSPVGFSN